MLFESVIGKGVRVGQMSFVHDHKRQINCFRVRARELMRTRTYEVYQHRIAAVPGYHGTYAVWRSSNCSGRSVEKRAFGVVWEPCDDLVASVIDGSIVLDSRTAGSSSALKHEADSIATTLIF